MPSFPRIVLMVTSWYTWFAAYVRMRNQYALRLSRNIASQPALAFSRPSGSVQPQHHASATRARRPMVTLAGTHGTTRVRPLLPLACLPACSLAHFLALSVPVTVRRWGAYCVISGMLCPASDAVLPQKTCFDASSACDGHAPSSHLSRRTYVLQVRISLQLFHSAFVSLHRSDA
ncbi:hypothetical protein IWX48DRAFT_39043 [Phyllosticta citricarpa]